MKVRTGVLIGLTITLMLLFAGTATAQRCEKVNAHLSDWVNYSSDESCWGEGHTECIAARLNGTINGRMLMNDPPYVYPPEIGDTVMWRLPVTFETKHGSIFADAVGMNFFLVWQTLGVGRVQQTNLIVAGTGRYEGATGVILAQWQGPDLIFGEASGEICWPEE
jgi:hypothetical protein